MISCETVYILSRFSSYEDVLFLIELPM